MAGVWTLYAPAVPPLPASSTAWQDGSYHIDVPGVLHRSDIFLGRPNTHASEAMPLGMAAWELRCAGGWVDRAPEPRRYTAGSLSPGKVVIPGLSAWTAVAENSGRLDLYDGEIREQGSGMQAVVYERPARYSRHASQSL